MSIHNAQSDAQAQLAELTARYCENLKDKRAALEVCFAHGQSHQWQQENIIQLKAIAHKLSGSAAMFGFSTLASKAKELDDCLAQTLKDAHHSELAHTLTPFFTILCQSLDETIASCDYC